MDRKEPAERTIARLEEELETQILANKELVRTLADVEAEKCAAAKARLKTLGILRTVVRENAETRQARGELLAVLRDLGEWRADKSLLRNAADVIRANAIALKSHREGSDQANRIIDQLIAARDQLHTQLLESEGEIARLQILVSTPMTMEQREADNGLLPQPSIEG